MSFQQAAGCRFINPMEIWRRDLSCSNRLEIETNPILLAALTMQASCQLHSYTLPRPGACRWARISDHVQCSAQKNGSRHGLPLIPPALLALVPAAWAEDLDEAGQQAVESLRSPYQFSGPKAVYPGTEAAKSVADAAGSAADAAGISLPDVQLPSLPSGLSDSLLDNPLLVVGGLALLAIPLIAIGLTGSGSKVKGVSAAKALDALANNPSAVIIDLRSKADVKEEGSPDLRSVKARLTSLPFTKVVKGEVVEDESFQGKLERLSALKEDSTVILLDSSGREAKAVGAVVQPLVQAVLYVNGGAQSWKAADLPWREPSKGFDLSGLKLGNLSQTVDDLAEDFKKQPTTTKAGLAVGAIGLAAVALFQEAEIVLEVLGAAAAGNFALKRLLYANDREKTFTEIKKLVKDQVALDELPKDLRNVADKFSRGEISSKDLNKAVKESAGSLSEGTKTVRAGAGAATKQAEKAAPKVVKEAQKAAQQAPKVAKDAQKSAASAGEQLSKDAPASSKEAGKKVASTADKAQKEAADTGKEVKKDVKAVGKEVKNDVKTAGKDAKQGGAKVESSAPPRPPQNLAAAKSEIVQTTKENVAEAEDTMAKNKKKASSNGAPSKEDVKSQAKEARAWINQWRERSQ